MPPKYHSVLNTVYSLPKMAIFGIHWLLNISWMTPLMHNGNIIRLICISGCAWESMYFIRIRKKIVFIY